MGGVQQDGGGTAGGGEQGAQSVIWVDVARVVVRVAGEIRNVRLLEPLGVPVAHDDQPAGDAKVLRCSQYIQSILLHADGTRHQRRRRHHDNTTTTKDEEEGDHL